MELVLGSAFLLLDQFCILGPKKIQQGRPRTDRPDELEGFGM